MEALFRSPLGALLAQPWVDPAGLFGLQRWYLPLSRLWAAANVAGGDVDRFRAEASLSSAVLWAAPAIEQLLGRQQRREAESAARRDDWERALFGSSGEDAATLDRRRRSAATAHQAMRAAFYPLLFPQRPPSVRWRIDPPAEVRARLAALLADPDALYAAAPDAGSVEASVSWLQDGRRETWWRAPTPSPRLLARPGSERLYARVIEPADRPAEATLVLGNGLGIEFDVLTLVRDPGAALADHGWRVIEPVSPYHGLRGMPGTYGGEPFLASAPTATVDLIAGQAVETALLVAACRARFGGPVAVAGISMTSFVMQQVAGRCDLWPAASRPDAAMLISHSGRLEDVTFGGTLAAAVGLDREMARAGWTREQLRLLAPLIDAPPCPALPPERILSVLGTTDRWVPYGDGAAVAEAWRLPEENVFRYPLGHLGMPVQLVRDGAPFARLRRVLSGG